MKVMTEVLTVFQERLISYTYNSDGKLTSKTDEGNSFGFQKLVKYNIYQYDEGGILISEIFGNNYFNYLGVLDEDFSSKSKHIKTLEYDESGNLIVEKFFYNLDEVSVPFASTFYSYDDDGSTTILR